MGAILSKSLALGEFFRRLFLRLNPAKKPSVTLSVWSRFLPEDRVRHDHHEYPIWPSEPDLEAVKDILASELFRDGDRHNHSELQVRFLADGAHHKVYEATHPSWTKPYLLRVAIGVDPCLKTESEMATIAFIRQRTTIPAPKVIAWNSGADSRIGYEWSITEKSPGIPLNEIWFTVPWDKRVAIVREMAGFMTQMWDQKNRFNAIGSLYLAQNDTATPDTQIVPRHVRLNDIKEPKFILGPAMDFDLYDGRRHYLPSSRGPFKTTRGWCQALIDVQREFLKSAKLLLGARETAPLQDPNDDKAWATLVEDEIGVDAKGFPEEFDTAMANYQIYEDFLPTLFPSPRSNAANLWGDEEEPSYLLFHGDLRDANILVDPDTFAITGILDWENVMTLPAWFALDHPNLINMHLPYHEEGEPPIPETYDEEDENYMPISTPERIRWEAMILRQEFDKRMEELGWSLPWDLDTGRDRLIRRFRRGVQDIYYNCDRTTDVHKELFSDAMAKVKEEEQEINDLKQKLMEQYREGKREVEVRFLNQDN